MLQEIIRYEINFRAKRADTYLYFFVLLLCSLVAPDLIFEGRLGLVKENAPYVIATCMSIYSAFFLLIVSMLVGVAVLRDYQHGMTPLLFTRPIRKWHYFLGRWLGSLVVLALVFTGLLWGMMLSEVMPWREAEDLLPFNGWHYLQPFLCIVLPTLFMTGAVFFVGGALSKKMLVVYTQGIFLLMIYLVAMITTRDVADPFWGALLDPFGFELIGSQVRFLTPEERNQFVLPLGGVLLLNRVWWLLVGVAALGFGYRKFGFRARTQVQGKVKGNDHPARPEAGRALVASPAPLPAPTPVFTRQTGRRQLAHLTVFHFRALLREASFRAIVVCGGLIIFLNGITVGTTYGVDSLPVTYLVVEELQELAIGFFLLILLFYSGELIWRERTAKADVLLDAYPVATATTLTGKFLALLLVYVLLTTTLILSGIAYQLLHGFAELQLAVYATGFGLGLLPMVVLYTVAAFFLQVITNRKAVGYLATLVFVVATVIAAPLGLEHPLLRFAAAGPGTYSAMNGYGHFLEPFGWITLYWGAFCLLLFLVAIRLFDRGRETGLRKRWKAGERGLTPGFVRLGLGTVAVFLLAGSFIFYNTNVLNRYTSSTAGNAWRAGYEQTLGQYRNLPQPAIVAVSLQTALYPEERAYRASGVFVLKNTTDRPISEIHLQKNPDDRIKLEQIAFSVANTPNPAHQRYDHCIYVLAQKMLPGDSLTLTFTQTFTTRGFAAADDTDVVANGTFFSSDHFPTLGYNPKIELADNQERKNHGLPPHAGKADRADAYALTHGQSAGSGDNIRFEMTVSTAGDQTAVAPGNLLRQWTEGGRNYFHYRMDRPMINFYSVVSARYAVRRDTWQAPTDSAGSVALEIYHHPGHERNLDRMMAALKASLTYYSTEFSPYQYNHVRITEFPRYRTFAQSFPGTIPFAESMGFLLDIDDAEDVDMAAMVTAHELAHQWWGMQLVAANVEGKHLILESLAQYSALMVLRQLYPETKIRQFLDRERKQYLQARAAAQQREVPLAVVDNQHHLYYKKGAINLFALQDYISEDSLNLALRRFLADWNFVDGRKQTDRFATSADLLGYLRGVTPDSLQYLVRDLFETITLYDNAALSADFQPLAGGKYRVNLTLQTEKFRVDTVGREIAVPVDDFINVGVYGRDQHGADSLLYLARHRFTEPVTTLQIEVNGEPGRVGIDPRRLLVNREGGAASQLFSPLRAL